MLVKDLHELEALQATRAGRSTPLPSRHRLMPNYFPEPQNAIKPEFESERPREITGKSPKSAFNARDARDGSNLETDIESPGRPTIDFDPKSRSDRRRRATMAPVTYARPRRGEKADDFGDLPEPPRAR